MDMTIGAALARALAVGAMTLAGGVHIAVTVVRS